MMRSLNSNFAALLSCFNSHGVIYMVIGGYAVNYHGYHRNTQDIDLWYWAEPRNAERVSLALQAFGFSASAVTPAQFLQLKSIFVFGRPPFRVDLVNTVDGVEFLECYPRRVEAELDGVRVPFISLPDLLTNKRAADRIKDRADVEGLPEG
jgi:hypothetical protein